MRTLSDRHFHSKNPVALSALSSWYLNPHELYEWQNPNHRCGHFQPGLSQDSRWGAERIPSPIPGLSCPRCVAVIPAARSGRASRERLCRGQGRDAASPGARAGGGSRRAGAGAAPAPGSPGAVIGRGTRHSGEPGPAERRREEAAAEPRGAEGAALGAAPAIDPCHFP